MEKNFKENRTSFPMKNPLRNFQMNLTKSKAKINWICGNGNKKAEKKESLVLKTQELEQKQLLQKQKQEQAGNEQMKSFSNKNLLKENKQIQRKYSGYSGSGRIKNYYFLIFLRKFHYEKCKRNREFFLF